MKKLKELSGSQYFTPKSLREYQERKFKELIEHAKSNVPYYRKTLKDIDISSLDDIKYIPFLSKKIIQENSDALKAENIPAHRFIPHTTGGSTGEKLEIYSDTESSAAALSMRTNQWAGWNPGEKQLQLWGSHQDLANIQSLYKTLILRLVHRNMILSSYQMTDQDILNNQRIINRFRPRLITGYTSAMYLMSRYIKDNGLEVYSPKGIVCSAETLRDDQRQTIESVFRCPVLNRYGCREVGNIAQECSQQNGLHINSEHVIVEVVDDQGRPCPPGEMGEIVLTGLNNHTFPFIRYKVGDIGALTDRECPCGRGLPMLDYVKGRVWDVIVGANGNRLVGTFWLIEGVKGIRQYQVIQREYGCLTVKLVAGPRFGEEEKDELRRRVRENCGEEMKLDIDIVDEIPLSESGKHRFIISHVSPFIE